MRYPALRKFYWTSILEICHNWSHLSIDFEYHPWSKSNEIVYFGCGSEKTTSTLTLIFYQILTFLVELCYLVTSNLDFDTFNLFNKYFYMFRLIELDLWMTGANDRHWVSWRLTLKWFEYMHIMSVWALLDFKYDSSSITFP